MTGATIGGLIHPAIVGNLDPTSGPRDLDTAVHTWVNPIAYVTVTVRPGHRHGHDY